VLGRESWVESMEYGVDASVVLVEKVAFDAGACQREVKG
jgi:hypothetical protein